MKSLFLSLSILITIALISQENSNKIGYMFDVEGNLIYHYLDGRYYAENIIKKEIDPSREFVPGCFTMPEQDAVCGLVKLRRNTHLILFKKHTDSTEIKLTKKALESYSVMGKEYVMEFEDEVNTRQDLRAFGDWDIFYTYNEEFDGKKIEYNAVNFESKQVFSFKGPTSANKRFREDFTTAFKDFPLVCSIVENKKLKFHNFESLTLLLQLEYQYQNDTNLYYNEDLEKVETPSSYYLQVDSIIGNKFFMTYLRAKGLKAFSVTYGINAVDDLIKVRSSIKYGDENKPLMVLDYKAGRVDSIKTFHENGNLFEVYRSVLDRAEFKEVFDREGNQVLDSEGNGEVVHLDKINNRQIKNEYENFRLLSSSFIDSTGRRFFLYTQDHLRYKFFEKFAMSADKIFEDFQLSPNDSDLNFGYLLLECIVNEKGKAESLTIKKALNPKLDQSLTDKLSSYLIGKKEFIAGEYKKDDVSQIVIFPLYLGYVDFDLFHNSHWTDGFKSGGYWLNNPYYMNAFPSLTY